MDPMKRFLVVALAILVVPAALAYAHAPAPRSTHHQVTFESARLTAQARVHKGTLTSHALVHEHDRLLYSFWFNEPGKSGVKEVDVDGSTGKVVKAKHESVHGEEQEKLKEAKARR